MHWNQVGAEQQCETVTSIQTGQSETTTACDVDETVRGRVVSGEIVGPAENDIEGLQSQSPTTFADVVRQTPSPTVKASSESESTDVESDVQSDFGLRLHRDETPNERKRRRELEERYAPENNVSEATKEILKHIQPDEADTENDDEPPTIAAIDAMENFTGENETQDIEVYIRSFERALGDHVLTNWQIQLALLGKLKGHAKELCEGVRATTYMELRAAVIELLARPKSYYIVSRLLANRLQQPDESGRSYVVAMEHLADWQPIDESDVVAHIINGLRPVYHNTPEVYIGCRTLKRLKRIIDNIEDKLMHQRAVQQTVRRPTYSPAHANRSKTEVRKPSPPTSGSDDKRKKSRSCYRCSQTGHYWSECPNAGRGPDDCFVCNRPGHQKADCPVYQRRLRENQK